MAFTHFGKRVLSAYLILFVLDIIVLALAARVNIWQEFFFMADLFPLGLSIASLVVLLLLLLSAGGLKYTFIARPAFHMSIFGLLSIFWLGEYLTRTKMISACLRKSSELVFSAFNAFSTSRWSNIPFPCSIIPDEYADERGWCQEVQALKAFVWILFVGVLITTTFVTQHVFSQHRHGNRQIWKFSLMHFDPRSAAHQGHARSTSVTAGYFGRAASSYIPGIDSKW
ncbi:hypothetical protein BC629DRAFT_612452 [Irpex lacteus]|nr:hypothetical protein BC629DRAFT_612452 [Irpex lacteus]